MSAHVRVKSDPVSLSCGQTRHCANKPNGLAVQISHSISESLSLPLSPLCLPGWGRQVGWRWRSRAVAPPSNCALVTAGLCPVLLQGSSGKFILSVLGKSQAVPEASLYATHQQGPRTQSVHTHRPGSRVSASLPQVRHARDGSGWYQWRHSLWQL